VIDVDVDRDSEFVCVGVEGVADHVETGTTVDESSVPPESRSTKATLPDVNSGRPVIDRKNVSLSNASYELPPPPDVMLMMGATRLIDDASSSADARRSKPDRAARC